MILRVFPYIQRRPIPDNTDGNQNLYSVTYYDDKAGRLKTLMRNGKTALKSTYSYNIRSWLYDISGTLFSETLSFVRGSPARYGGDVSKVTWKDDRNGNITTLQRYGRTGASTYGRIDYLTLSYSGNRLSTVKDTGSAAYGNDFRYSNTTSTTYSYTHDAAGRMTKDAAKGISLITWNVLGLPQTVTFSSGVVINYSYAADGTKLRESKTASGTTTTTDYTGTLVLEDGTRSRMLFDGGYVSLSDNAYHFFITDHLGSVRVVASANGVAEEYNHYYPLGGLLPTSTSSTGIQPVKYQGKEWAGAKGLNLYDFGARRYDPATGRWLSPDALAEKYYGHSPYLFCAANPMKYVDPEGNSIRIRKNVNDALLDLAHIVATERGANRVSKLIEALPQYELTPVPFSGMAMFTGKEIRYVTNPFRNRDGGTPSEFVAMGHEISHAYDYSVGYLSMHSSRSRGNTDQTESNAVSFENYLRSVYMMPDLRKKYSGKILGVGSFKPKITRSKGEYIDGFEEIGRNQSETSIGYKYDKHTDNGDRTMFLIVGVDSKDHFYFNHYETEEEYRNAAKNW